MSLGPSGAAHLRNQVETIRIEPRSTTARAKEEKNLTTQGHLQAYLEEAMERFQQEQWERAYQVIYPNQRINISNISRSIYPEGRDGMGPIASQSIGHS